MKNRRFEEIPEALREGWEPTDAGKAWVELLGPHVPEDVKRWTPDTDSGVLLSDPTELLAADNSFAAAIERAKADRVLMPALQVMTSTYFLAHVPHEGDCLMFFCYRGSETAEVVVWNHETHEFYGPVAYDLPTMVRLAEVADSNEPVEARAEALRPCLGRWRREAFPLSLFERALVRDGVWSQDGEWPEVEAPESFFEGIANRAWWVAKALINSNPETDHIAAQLDATPDGAFAAEDFQDLPYSALYWLWRTYFLGEDAWHRPRSRVARRAGRGWCATPPPTWKRRAPAGTSPSGASTPSRSSSRLETRFPPASRSGTSRSCAMTAWRAWSRRPFRCPISRASPGRR